MSRNQKLRDSQIQAIKKLKRKGVRISFIAKVIHHGEGLSLSAVYYHLSDRRSAYDNNLRRHRVNQQTFIRQRIGELLSEGYTTGFIAEDWNVPLATINKIYTSK